MVVWPRRIWPSLSEIFECVAVEGVTQTDPFGALLQTGGYLTSEVGGHFAGALVDSIAQEAQHIDTGEAADSAMQKLRIELRQRRAILNAPIGSKLSLAGLPVVPLRNGLSDLCMQSK